ncbi:MAG: NAD(P)/FAD-dependent oxidoreductase, partial [Planctomycetota bacterium]
HVHRLRKAPVDVVIVDRQNHHLFQPLLYQVATAGLAGPDIAAPIRRILRRHRNTRVIYGEVEKIDPEEQAVHVQGAALRYDTLVVATGATHAYFGHDEWERYAPGLKTLGDAQRIRSHVLRAFESAERLEDPESQASWLRFVVVGAGPTGVELAGALAELSRKILPRDFRRFDGSMTEVILLEAGPRVLAPYTEELSRSAKAQLEDLGVNVRTGSSVTDIDEEGVTLDSGEKIPARTVLWAAGVRASRILEDFNAPLDRSGRLLVEPDLTVPGHPSVYVLGDAAHLEQDGSQVPGVAPAAMQMGKYAAASIVARLKVGRSSPPRRPFRYRDKGSMATIGRASAVADLGKIKLRGFMAWIAWLFIHLLFLVGFRSKIVVMINWAWAYIGYRPAARVLSDLAHGETAARVDEESPSS